MATAFSPWFESDSARYRWSVASRTLAAVVGGYAHTSLFTVALSMLLAQLGMNLAEAVLATTMGSFMYYAVLIMAVFHARSATRGWLLLAGTAVPMGLIVMALLPGAV